ncbi:hypothetical protein V1387_18240 [Allomuricauda taeanensis]|uniref:hypothetical protein n=1 Tax=Flagellimonas taeanensis TaxID=1005926 RepID=UPI002E7B284E|nr:hypothetical protein [Allomuricauda taeanensis]MEE1964631.1 hypothetical protein [Allomuricauda taeanensis]
MEVKRGSKYPVVIERRQRNWKLLSQYFEYARPIGHLEDYCTTNAVQGFHGQIQNQRTSTNDMSLLKLVYLATRNIENKWTSPLQNWSLVIQQLYIKFGERIPFSLNT